MSLVLCLQNDSFLLAGEQEDLHNRLEIIQEVAEHAKIAGDRVYYNQDIYNIQFEGVTLLCDWLYDTQTSRMRDEQRLLSLIINTSEEVDNNELQTFLTKIESFEGSREFSFLCLYRTDESYYYIYDLEDLHVRRRIYLYDEDDKMAFLNAARFCFPNLHFHEHVEKSLDTLSAPLREYNREIIRHLSALNDQFPGIYREYKGRQLGEVLKVFSTTSEIACTLEGDSDSAKRRFSFEFTKTSGGKIVLVCEPHTKLEGTGSSGDTKYRFDRIYFFQGEPSIHDGKILVAHIGEHL
ncbi:hypothetical protein [Paenibacillus sp. MBLB4367]|uniref:hypothetical protein n=1 Tax=Paenibacillus sp. MBLB4367 TaxID=3384767 RepID=UPI0039083300